VKRLVVNADDFGMSSGANRGIIRAHEQGIVTSASLMVRWPAADEAAAYARSHPQLSVGLHIDLCEWTFVNEAWRPVYEVVPTGDAAAVAKEITRQLEVFRQLVGRYPTHLDSHQHVHRTEPIHSILLREAVRLGVILRSTSSEVRYCGDFYGQSTNGYPYPEGISVEALLRILQQLPDGITELSCHPAEEADMGSTYRNERIVERQALCDPRVIAAIKSEQIELCSFGAITGQNV
jgi:predicted glycoside hydrolase/deacetylase ChbG (UPF0249 family)